MSKIIIHNNTNRSVFQVMQHVASVMAEGRVSDEGKSYCAIIKFHDGIMVATRRNKNSDTFYVEEV